jgi:poly(3-hydroxyalkanoate) synthetase
MPQNEANNTAKQTGTTWMRFFVKYEPTDSLKNVKIPVLAVNGEKDLQVPAEINLKIIDIYSNFERRCCINSHGQDFFVISMCEKEKYKKIIAEN